MADARRDVGIALVPFAVNVDVGTISWQLPRAEFHRYLRRLVEAGFGKRVTVSGDISP
jgi:hypothetical protein